MSDELIFGIIFSLLGGLLVLIGVFIFIRTKIFIGKSQKANGTVIEMVYSNSSDDSSGGYSPVYQFRTLDGQTIVKEDTLSSNPPRFHVGQELEILYESENPQKARINKWFNLYLVPLILGFVGLIFGGVGIVIVIPQVLKLLGF